MQNSKRTQNRIAVVLAAIIAVALILNGCTSNKTLHNKEQESSVNTEVLTETKVTEQTEETLRATEPEIDKLGDQSEPSEPSEGAESTEADVTTQPSATTNDKTTDVDDESSNPTESEKSEPEKAPETKPDKTKEPSEPKQTEPTESEPTNPTPTEPEVTEPKPTTPPVTEPPSDEKEYPDDYLGRFKIPSVGVNVACYKSAAQSVVDAKDSAAYFYSSGHAIIADHVDQGFSAIKSCVKWTSAKLETPNGTRYYTCVGKINGHNTGVELTDSNYNSIKDLYPGALVCYTCNGSWQNVVIVFFSDGSISYDENGKVISESEYDCTDGRHAWGEKEVAWEVFDGDGNYRGWDKRVCIYCGEEDWIVRTEPSEDCEIPEPTIPEETEDPEAESTEPTEETVPDESEPEVEETKPEEGTDPTETTAPTESTPQNDEDGDGSSELEDDNTTPEPTETEPIE